MLPHCTCTANRVLPWPGQQKGSERAGWAACRQHYVLAVCAWGAGRARLQAIGPERLHSRTFYLTLFTLRLCSRPPHVCSVPRMYRFGAEVMYGGWTWQQQLQRRSPLGDLPAFFPSPFLPRRLFAFGRFSSECHVLHCTVGTYSRCTAVVRCCSVTGGPATEILPAWTWQPTSV